MGTASRSRRFWSLNFILFVCPKSFLSFNVKSITLKFVTASPIHTFTHTFTSMFVLLTLRNKWKTTTRHTKRQWLGETMTVRRLFSVSYFDLFPHYQTQILREQNGNKLQNYILAASRGSMLLVGNQLDAQFLLWYVYLNPLHVSNNYVLILRRTIVWIQLLV